MLEKIAYEKITSLPLADRKAIDQIEVYLGYPIKLQQRLKLDIAVQAMHFFSLSKITDADLELAVEYVVHQQTNKDATCAFLSSRKEWRNVLKAQYPKEWEKIVQENCKELETSNEAQDNFNQLKINRKKRWECLTTKALRQMNQGAFADKEYS